MNQVPDFTAVTEVAGDYATTEQIERLAHRYYWAGQYCRDRDVLEVACGAGQGLGYLSSISKSIRAGDISAALVAKVRAHYGDRIAVTEMDAQSLPFPDQSLDVVILFEAIYYLPTAESFVDECRRVLRPGGQALVVTANKNLYDFNPSPFSNRYFGVTGLHELFGKRGFLCEFFGVTPVDGVPWRQKILRPIKLIAVKLNMIPGTMRGKAFLKRLVFGELVPMPAEIKQDGRTYNPPTSLNPDRDDYRHKVIYLVATLTEPR